MFLVVFVFLVRERGSKELRVQMAALRSVVVCLSMWYNNCGDEGDVPSGLLTRNTI